jgi:hypothetical protein
MWQCIFFKQVNIICYQHISPVVPVMIVLLLVAGGGSSSNSNGHSHSVNDGSSRRDRKSVV